VPTTVAAAGSLLSKFMIIALPSILRATAEKKTLTASDSIRLGSAEKKFVAEKEVIEHPHTLRMELSYQQKVIQTI